MQKAGRWGLPPEQPSEQQPSQQGNPGAADMSGNGDEMPEPPGFFSRKEEAETFLKWMDERRAARVRAMEGRQDDEVAGIAWVYLAIAVVIIAFALLAAHL